LWSLSRAKVPGPFSGGLEEKMSAPKGSGTFWLYELFPKKARPVSRRRFLNKVFDNTSIYERRKI